MCQETCTLANTCGFVAATHRLSNGRRDSVADNRRRAASAGASSWNCRGEPVNSVALNRGRAREPRGSSRRDYPSEGRRPRTRVSPSASCFFFFPSTLTFEAEGLETGARRPRRRRRGGQALPRQPFVLRVRAAASAASSRHSHATHVKVQLRAANPRCHLRLAPADAAGLQRRLGSVRTTWTAASLHPLIFFLPPYRLHPILGYNADLPRVYGFRGKAPRRFDLPLLREELIRPDSRTRFSQYS